MKRFIFCCISVFATLQLFAVSFTVDSITYTILGYNHDDSDSVKVSRCEKVIGDVVIPASVTNENKTYRVVAIGQDAFIFNGLTSITIPNSITSIENGAFSVCDSLTAVYISDMTSWCAIDFSDASSNPLYHAYNLYLNGELVTDLTIPEGITTIKRYTFYNCRSLTNVTIPNSVINIDRSAFSNCRNLIDVTIPEGVTSIGNGAFRDCRSLTSVTIPNSVTTIGDNAFYFVPNIVYNGPATYEEDNYAWGARGLNGYLDGYLVYNDNTKTKLWACSAAATGDIIIPNSVTNIGKSAFAYCSGLTSVTISYGVTGIDTEAFYYCSSLTSITIPNSVTSIGTGVFASCNGLTKIIVEEGNTNYDSRNNCNAIIETASNTLIQGCMNTTIPNDITSIGDSAFYNCSGLKNIIIPESVTHVGDYAFKSCSSLTNVTIPNSVTSIGEYAFDCCHSLTSITLPESVTHVGKYAFYCCCGLTSVTIPNSVISIGDYAFYNCRSLTSVTIPNSVTSIGDRAFYNVPNIVYSGSATGAPWGAKSMNGYVDGYLVYSDNTKTILLVCSAAATGEITIPNSVIHIGERAFFLCSGLTSITIPNSVTYIGNRAFENCSGLTAVHISDIAAWCAIDFNDFGGSNTNPLYYAKNLYLNGELVTDLIIPESVETIQNYAFYNCSSLTSVTIPNSVTSIGYNAFCGCSSLTSVTIGKSVTSIGYDAFYNCRNLKNMRVLPLTPPTLGNNVFYNVPSDISIQIHCESLSDYQQKSGWSDFRDSYVNNYLYDIDLQSSDFIMGEVIFIQQPECDGVAIIEAVPTDGHYFLRWSDENTENPRTITLTQDTLLKAEFYAIGTGNGRCGDNLYWTLADGNLFITGSGAMYDFTEETQPWYLMKDYIRSISFPADMTTIGDSAFYRCKNITSVVIPQNVTIIGDYSFAECTALERVVIGAGVTSIRCGAFYNDWRIEEITCYPVLVPEVCENSFYNVSNLTYLYVQSDRMRQYQLNPYLKDFDIRPIGATEVNSSTEVTVIPSERDAQFTWPANNNASSYTLQITKDGEVFCTLVFNEYGQLTGIAFAPARNGEQRTRAATPTSNGGWQFTVTGLNEGSAYAYTLDVKDAADNVLNSYNGTFRTEGGAEEPVLWTLSVYSDNPEWGSVTGAGTYEDGTEAIIEAIPAMGYRFLYWNDNNTANPRTVLMTADAAYTAYFDRITQGTDDLSSDMLTHPCKVLENGTIYILLPDGRKLNLQGAEVK